MSLEIGRKSADGDRDAGGKIVSGRIFGQNPRPAPEVSEFGLFHGSDSTP